MANATYTGTQLLRPQHNSSEAGNTWTDQNETVVTATFATTDVVEGLYVPAGTRLCRLWYRWGDLDTGTTLTLNIGYRSRHPLPQLSANATAFASASAAGQAAVAAWTELVFSPIDFDEPVSITLIPAVAATGTTGSPSIHIMGMGQVIGIKG